MTPTIFDWARYRSAAYLVGKGIHYGVGVHPILPRAAKSVGCFCVGVNPAHQASAEVCSEGLEVFADGVFDWVFVGGAIEALPDPKTLLQQAFDKLRIGGHLIALVPLNSDPAPHILHSFSQEDLVCGISSCGAWKRKQETIKDKHFFGIYKKVGPRKGEMQDIKRPEGKRACIVRYGAFGDMIMVTPVIRKLHQDGWHVTVNCTSYSKSILDHNPHVDNIVVQEREAIPNPQLGPYWSEWQQEYDRYINLSESIEGKLLAVEGRPEFYAPQAFRQWRGDKNYYEFTLSLAGLEGASPDGELYFSPSELSWAKGIRRQYANKFMILWSLTGSSHHKIYGLFEPVMMDWLDAHPNAVVFTTGDQLARLLELDHPQAVKCASVWDIRKAMCMTQFVDVVVGPETGVLNAAGCFDTPKIVLLSHSTPNALTKHWRNCTSLEPSREISPCYPCFQLHFSRGSCPQADIVCDDKIVASGPKCAMGAISGERVVAALDAVFAAWQEKKSK